MSNLKEQRILSIKTSTCLLLKRHLVFFLDPVRPIADVDKPIVEKTEEAKGYRNISIGVNKVAESPQDAEFKDAAVYKISGLPPPKKIGKGDCLEVKYKRRCRQTIL